MVSSDCLVLCRDGVKVWRRVVPVVHRDHDSVETADLRHRTIVAGHLKRLYPRL